MTYDMRNHGRSGTGSGGCGKPENCKRVSSFSTRRFTSEPAHPESDELFIVVEGCLVIVIPNSRRQCLFHPHRNRPARPSVCTTDAALDAALRGAISICVNSEEDAASRTVEVRIDGSRGGNSCPANRQAFPFLYCDTKSRNYNNFKDLIDVADGTPLVPPTGATLPDYAANWPLNELIAPCTNV